MKDAKTITAIADLITANGGAEFARGYIDGLDGNFSSPYISYKPDYSRGFISTCGFTDLKFLASYAIPGADREDLNQYTAEMLREKLLKRIQ